MGLFKRAGGLKDVITLLSKVGIFRAVLSALGTAAKAGERSPAFASGNVCGTTLDIQTQLLSVLFHVKCGCCVN